MNPYSRDTLNGNEKARTEDGDGDVRSQSLIGLVSSGIPVLGGIPGRDRLVRMERARHA